MKIYQIIILLILVGYIYLDDSIYCNGSEPNAPSKAEDCSIYSTKGGHCCFIHSINGDFCYGFGPRPYRAISEIVKSQKKCNSDMSDYGYCLKDKNYSIDCKSSYLALSSLLLILLIL